MHQLIFAALERQRLVGNEHTLIQMRQVFTSDSVKAMFSVIDLEYTPSFVRL